jgi:hypothetical protein
MNDEHDNDLRAMFAWQRCHDGEHAPAWRPELLLRAAKPSRVTLRRLPAAFVTACLTVLSVFLTTMNSPPPAALSELPPLFDSPPAQWFQQLEPPLLAFEAPSDFLLPRLNTSIP